MPTPSATLDTLDLRIVNALQIDGRAPWRKIAAVLGQPERSVARRGSELLARGLVSVIGMRPRGSQAVLRLQCQPGMNAITAQALAQRKDTTFSYVMTGGADVVAELMTDSAQFAHALGNEIQATPGLVRAISLPALHYFRTIRGWTANALSETEVAALRTELTSDTQPDYDQTLSPHDDALIEVLVEDGRAPLEAIARRIGVSESTAARRLEYLLRQRLVVIRALIEPRLVGLPAEAMLWITTSPSKVERVGQALAALPEVRYAVAVAGAHQIVADVTVKNNQALYSFMTDGQWARDTHSVEMSLMVNALKRGGLVRRSP